MVRTSPCCSSSAMAEHLSSRISQHSDDHNQSTHPPQTLSGSILLVHSFTLSSRAGLGPQPTSPDWPVVAAVLDLVVTFGICPNLSPGVGISRPNNSSAAAAAATAISEHLSSLEASDSLQASGLDKAGELGVLLVSAEVLASVVLDNSDGGSTTVSVKSRLDRSPMAQLVMDCYLSDVMAAYLQLAYGPPPQELVVTKDGKKLAEDRLLEITQKLPVGQVVEASFALLNQSCQLPPTWLKSEVGKLLSKLVMREGGVAAVLQRLVGGAVKGSTQLYERVATHLAKIPRTVAKAEDYYRTICPQLLPLLLLLLKVSQSETRDYEVACQTLRNIHLTSAFLACNMIVNEANLADIYLIRPLLRPLLVWSSIFDEKDVVEGQEGSTLKETNKIMFEGGFDRLTERALVNCLLQVHLLITTGHRSALFVKEQILVRMKHIAPLLLKLHHQLEATDGASTFWNWESQINDETGFLQSSSAAIAEQCVQSSALKLGKNGPTKGFLNKGTISDGNSCEEDKCITGKLRIVITDIVLALATQPLEHALPVISTFFLNLNTVVLKWPQEAGEIWDALNSTKVQACSPVKYVSRLMLMTENWPLTVALMGEVLHKILNLRKCLQQTPVQSPSAEAIHYLMETFELMNEMVGTKALEHDVMGASVLIKALLDDETVFGDEDVVELILHMVHSVLNGFCQDMCDVTVDNSQPSSIDPEKLAVMVAISLSLQKVCKNETISETLKRIASTLDEKISVFL